MRSETAYSETWHRIMPYHRPQTKFAKVMFLQVSVCPQRGACVAGGHAWWGVCMVGGMHGRGEVCVAGGACMAGGCAWQGGHAWQGGMRGRGVRDTFNERAVRILLECILVKCINLIEIAVYFAAHFSVQATASKVPFHLKFLPLMFSSINTTRMQDSVLNADPPKRNITRFRTANHDLDRGNTTHHLCANFHNVYTQVSAPSVSRTHLQQMTFVHS